MVVFQTSHPKTHIITQLLGLNSKSHIIPSQVVYQAQKWHNPGHHAFSSSAQQDICSPHLPPPIPVTNDPSGGSILTQLINHPIADTLSLTALVRQPYQASILKDAGVIPLLFKDLDDYDAIRDAAKDADGDSLLPSQLNNIDANL